MSSGKILRNYINELNNHCRLQLYLSFLSCVACFKYTKLITTPLSFYMIKFINRTRNFAAPWKSSHGDSC